MMHPCTVIHPNPNLPYFISVIVEELFLRRTVNIYNVNGCTVITYLFKDVVKEAEHIKNIIKKNIINVKYSSNV